MKKAFNSLGIFPVLFIMMSACVSGTPQPMVETPVQTTEVVQVTPTSIQPQTLTVMTHDSFNVSENVLSQFEVTNHVKVQFLKAGDTGTALNKAILSKESPLADVFYGVDNTFLSRALDEEIFQPYDSPLLADIPDSFELDPNKRALPVDYGDVCLNYYKAYFEQNQLAPPERLEYLLKPEYKELLVVENPATSSPGLAFLLATIGHFGEDGYLDFWEGLVKNQVKVVNDWETAYYTEFSRYGGSYPIFAEEPIEEPPTAAVTGEGSCFRQIEFVGILQGTTNRTLAEKWIDFMLSPTFQEDIPLQMFVFPVNEKAKLDETFVKYLAIPEKPAYVSPEKIAANREKWIQAWTELVLR